MNEYFYKVWIPLQIATLIAIILLITGVVQINWLFVLISWFLIGPVGMGVGFHRLFAHRAFKTFPIIEKSLAILGTLAGYSPLLFFAAQHQYHHKTSDSAADPSSPTEYGFWESFLWWRLRKSVMKAVTIKQYCVRIVIRDRFLVWVSKNFHWINLAYALILLACGPFWLINLYLIPTFIEHMRVNLISSLSHINVPFSYRTYKTGDDSQNNLVIGVLSGGFGWHNNHHARPRKMLSQEKWWEIDIEGYVAWTLNKVYELRHGK
jgi:fatty-acid desaturase